MASPQALAIRFLHLFVAVSLLRFMKPSRVELCCVLQENFLMSIMQCCMLGCTFFFLVMNCIVLDCTISQTRLCSHKQINRQETCANTNEAMSSCHICLAVLKMFEFVFFAKKRQRETETEREREGRKKVRE